MPPKGKESDPKLSTAKHSYVPGECRQAPKGPPAKGTPPAVTVLPPKAGPDRKPIARRPAGRPRLPPPEEARSDGAHAAPQPVPGSVVDARRVRIRTKSSAPPYLGDDGRNDHEASADDAQGSAEPKGDGLIEKDPYELDSDEELMMRSADASREPAQPARPGEVGLKLYEPELASALEEKKRLEHQEMD